MKIARRTQVQNLREVWKKEGDFSDWLATEDGLGLIAEDMGISIEDARRESRPGDFPCDIVGHLLGNPEHVVVIENGVFLIMACTSSDIRIVRHPKDHPPDDI